MWNKQCQVEPEKKDEDKLKLDHSMNDINIWFQESCQLNVSCASTFLTYTSQKKQKKAFPLLITDEENHSYLCNVSQWLFILHQHLSKLQSLFRVDPHHISEQKDPVWSVANLKPALLQVKPCRDRFHGSGLNNKLDFHILAANITFCRKKYLLII